MLPIKPKKINLLALTPIRKPSGLKDYNNLNEADINNILSFINYITINK